MIKINEVIVVEGKYDKIKLSGIIDAVIVTTDGFGIFKNKEKLKLLRRLAEKKGLLIMTDSDSAGFVIRNFLKGAVDPKYVKHAYIPDVFGKEKRKDTPSSEGKLGVEGVSKEAIIKALESCSVEYKTDVTEFSKKITVSDLYEDGFTGATDSKLKRTRLLKRLDLPEKLSTSALTEFLNTVTTYDEYKKIVAELQGDI